MPPPLTGARARQILERGAGLGVLVVGDAMVDTFIVGRVTRISPEAPVPVVAFDHEMRRLGGAANVAANVSALGGRAVLVGVVGRDEPASLLTERCREAGIATALVGDQGRPTTTKVRVVTDRNQQVARIDYERDSEIAGEVEDRVVDGVRTHARHVSVVVVSDYLKGAVTPAVFGAVLGAAAERGIPVLVDPKIPHLEYYAGSTVITPNHLETEQATHLRVRSDEEARQAARRFRELARCRDVLMTRGDQGMWLLAGEVEAPLPAAAREVADVTGAGDTVIATLALALAGGASMGEAAHLANQAAGIAVGRFGPAAVLAADLLAAFNGPAG
jgi:D-beta-D-heptose 7-phosphate kinase/D-beta-D-heptose 1-phosphate adenosyltransferase